MSGTRKHWQQRRVKGKDIVISQNPNTSPVKTPPVHDSRGNACNVVENCGKTAHRFHGSKFGCLEHQHLVFAAAAKSRGVKIELPEVNFEPDEVEIEA